MLFVMITLVASSGAQPLRASICEHPDKTLTAVRGDCIAPAQKTSVAGVNIFDQLWVRSQGMTTTGTIADSKAALQSAQLSGVRVFRFFASLWGPV